jgi:tetratricopeptide (TPR) repeat protein
MQLLRPLFASFLFLFATAAAWAGHITGQVRLDTGQTVDNVIVQLRSDMVAFQTETQTDRQGRFTFDGIPLTTYHLWIEYPGYHTYNTTIDISMSKMSYEGITLQKDRSKDVKEVPPEGPNATVDARMAQIPDDAKSEFQAGQKALDAKDGPGAIKHFQKAIELFPNYAEAYQLLGGAFLGGGNLAMAESAFVKAVTIEEHMVNAQLALGLTRNLMGKVREAEQPLVKAVQLDPKNPDAHFELAKNQFALQKFADAEASELKAISIDKDIPNFYYVLGLSRAMMGNTPGAEEPFTTLVTKDPANPDGHFELAKTEFALNKFSDAELHARKAIELKEKNPGVQVILAYALLRQQKAPEAKVAFQEYLKLDPNSPMKADVEKTIAMIEEHEKQGK